MFGTRLKEHTIAKGHTTSATAEHLKDSGHRIQMDIVRILQREDTTQRRKIKEAIQIYEKQPTLNRYQGIEIQAITLRVLSCDSLGSHDK